MSKYPVLQVTETTTEDEIYAAVMKHLQEQGGPASNGVSCVNRIYWLIGEVGS